MTSTTRSPLPARPPSRLRAPKSLGTFSSNAENSSPIPSPVTALTGRGEVPRLAATSPALAAGSSSKSDFPSTATKGFPDRSRSFARACSRGRASGEPLQTRTTISAPAILSRAFSSRDCPRTPASSRPAVSMRMQGPSPGISTALATGSVVVPGTSETMDTCCPAIALTRDDLPALRQPAKTMCNLSDCGVSMGSDLEPEIPFADGYPVQVGQGPCPHGLRYLLHLLADESLPGRPRLR